MILGGRNVQLHNDIVLFDPDKQPPTMDSIMTHAPLYNFSVCAVPDGFIMSGGIASTTSIPNVKQFSLTTLSWSDLPDMMKPVQRHGSAYLDGCLYTLGGCYRENGQTKQRYPSVHALDLSTLSWTECRPLSQAVDAPGIAVVDKDILAIGGYTGKVWLKQTLKYNSRTGKWSQCQPMPKTGCVDASTAVVNRQVFVLDRDLFLQYDVPTDTWTELSLPMKPSQCCAMVLKQKRLIALGGFDEEYKKPNDRVQTYDLASKTWKVEKSTMPVALLGHSAIVVKIPHTK